MAAHLIGIARTHELRAPMELLPKAVVTVERGIEGDARGAKLGRQVTVLFREGWEDACRAIDVSLAWTTRRANFYVEGLDFPREPGWRLAIGNVLLEVTQETAPCMLMEQVQRGLRQAMMPNWRGGVCTKIIRGGDVSVGDLARIA